MAIQFIGYICVHVCVCVYYCTNTTKSSDLITICYSFVGVKTTVRLFCNKNRFKAKLKVKKEDANLVSTGLTKQMIGNCNLP